MTPETHYTPISVPHITLLPPMPQPSMADEVHHRIANSLQLLGALVSLEARRIVDPGALAALEMTQQRIGAIAGVHRQLYRTSDAATIDLAPYLEALSEELDRGCIDSGAGRHVRVNAASVVVSSSDASMIGIIVAELVSNACKYAYETGQAGDVSIELRAMPFGGYRLDVSDRGRGMATTEMAHGSGLGTQLIAMMARRLDAHHGWHDTHPGTCFTLMAGHR